MRFSATVSAPHCVSAPPEAKQLRKAGLSSRKLPPINFTRQARRRLRINNSVPIFVPIFVRINNSARCLSSA